MINVHDDLCGTFTERTHKYIGRHLVFHSAKACLSQSVLLIMIIILISKSFKSATDN